MYESSIFGHENTSKKSGKALKKVKFINRHSMFFFFQDIYTYRQANGIYNPKKLQLAAYGQFTLVFTIVRKNVKNKPVNFKLVFMH